MQKRLHQSKLLDRLRGWCFKQPVNQPYDKRLIIHSCTFCTHSLLWRHSRLRTRWPGADYCHTIGQLLSMVKPCDRWAPGPRFPQVLCTLEHYVLGAAERIALVLGGCSCRCWPPDLWRQVDGLARCHAIVRGGHVTACSSMASVTSRWNIHSPSRRTRRTGGGVSWHLQLQGAHMLSRPGKASEPASGSAAPPSSAELPLPFAALHVTL